MSSSRKTPPSLIPTYLSVPLQVIESGAGFLSWCGASIGRFSASELLNRASKKELLSDFGDERFQQPFENWLSFCVDEEHALSYFGKFLLRQRTRACLANRLRFTEVVKRSPEIERIQIEKPIFVASPPRCGTTLLHNLLAQDPHARPLLFWEGSWPTPLSREQGNVERRARMAHRIYKILYALIPGAKPLHVVNPDGPMECGPLFNNSFILGYAFLFPKYQKWLLENLDVLALAYEEYRRQLLIFQWQRPTDTYWVLKSTTHLFGLRYLKKVFPDAEVIWIHRDPREFIPSICSGLVPLAELFLKDQVDPEWLGDFVLRVVDAWIREAHEAREQLAIDGVYDVYYRDLIRNGSEVVKGIYKHFGRPWLEEHENRARRWLVRNPQRKFGKHAYTLGQFGLSDLKIDDVLGWYLEQYNVSPTA